MSSCLVTEKVQVPEEVNFPPSVVSAPDAFELGTSLDQIVTFDLATDGPQLELPIIVRDPNVDQELVYEVWVDFTGTNLGARIQEATPISAMGVLERSLTVRIPATELAPSEGAAQRSACRKVEVLVTSEFAGGNVRVPAEPADIAQAVWWVRVIDTESDDTQVTLDQCP